MIDPEKIKKLILGSADDRALANEYIREYKLDITPDEFTQATWSGNPTYYTNDRWRDIWAKHEDNTWYKLETTTTVTASTTTKI